MARHYDFLAFSGHFQPFQHGRKEVMQEITPLTDAPIPWMGLFQTGVGS